jgi:hypothetical protein
MVRPGRGRVAGGGGGERMIAEGAIRTTKMYEEAEDFSRRMTEFARNLQTFQHATTGGPGAHGPGQGNGAGEGLRPGAGGDLHTGARVHGRGCMSLGPCHWFSLLSALQPPSVVACCVHLHIILPPHPASPCLQFYARSQS